MSPCSSTKDGTARPEMKAMPVIKRFRLDVMSAYLRVEMPMVARRPRITHKIPPRMGGGMEARLAPTCNVYHKSGGKNLLMHWCASFT